MPIPSRAWFPSPLTAQAQWYQTFMDNFTPALATLLGFLPAERSALEDDNTDLQFIANQQAALNNFVTAHRQFRMSLLEDPVGTPAAVFPNENFSAPPVGVAPGIFQRLIEAVDRIRAAPAYTDEIGANLGIVPAPKPPPEPNPKPVIDISAQPGGIVSVKFTRGDWTGVRLDMQVDEEMGWTIVGNYFKSPAEFTVPSIGATPHAVRVRARFLDGNSALGQYSDTANVTTIP